jgi:DNA-binding transcriptional ArsR family regulator
MPKRASRPPGSSQRKSAAPIFAALGDTTRLSLLDRLSAEGPLSITELTRGSRVTRQAITKHLRVLADTGLITGTRAGREALWELSPGQLRDAQHFLDAMSERWDSALSRLAAHLEDKPER